MGRLRRAFAVDQPKRRRSSAGCLPRLELRCRIGSRDEATAKILIVDDHDLSIKDVNFLFLFQQIKQPALFGRGVRRRGLVCGRRRPLRQQAAQDSFSGRRIRRGIGRTLAPQTRP